MSRIVVTGGEGFIGRYTRSELTQRGHDTTSLDLNGPRRWDVTRHHLPNAGKIDGIIHLAGMLGTHELYDHTDAAIDTNIKGTVRMLQEARSFEVPFVGIAQPRIWKNPYSITRAAARDMATAWHAAYGVRTSYVRAYNAYGPGQAHGPGHPQKILPTFAYNAWRGLPLPIWGDGQQLVDLVWVGDVARMLVDALEKGGNDETFDAGTGEGRTVETVAHLVNQVVRQEGGPGGGLQFLPMRRGEQKVRPLDNLASGEGWDLVGWQPGWERDRFRETVLAYRGE